MGTSLKVAPRGSEFFPLRAVLYGIPHWVTSLEHCFFYLMGATPMQGLRNFRLINVLCSVFETSFSAPDNFDYQSVPV